MKRLIATALLITAFSAPAMAESPSQSKMHSWDYVQTVGNPPPAAAPAPVEHMEQPRHYHHDGEGHHGKHHKKHHEEKAAKEHKGGKHHHHHKGEKAKDKPAEAPKQ